MAFTLTFGGTEAAEQPRGMAALYVAVTRTTGALCFIGGQELPVLAAVLRAQDASSELGSG